MATEYHRDKNYVEFEDVRCKHETVKALLCVIEGKEVWIPKSVVHDDSECYKSNTDGTMILPAWFCNKEGLI